MNSNERDDSERQKPLYRLSPRPSAMRALVLTLCFLVVTTIAVMVSFWAGYTMPLRQIGFLAAGVIIGVVIGHFATRGLRR